MYFFFKQKTAYELRISDWSSDVCSSDLRFLKSSVRQNPLDESLPCLVGCRGECGSQVETSRAGVLGHVPFLRHPQIVAPVPEGSARYVILQQPRRKIGRASCGERVCPYV